MKLVQVHRLTRAEAGVDAPGDKHSIYLVVLLIVAVIALYLPVTSHPFANYDDPDYIVRNQHIHDGLTADSFAWAFTTFDEANWHPLTWISHAADTSAFGLTPAGPHTVNLALHALNVLLLFWVLNRATGFTRRSLMVAALFALHPINVESVAWIAERKNLLSMTFFLLALAAYRWYAEDEGRIGRYLIVVLLFAFGLMAKPQIITLPFVLLLWDYWPLRRVVFAGKSHPPSHHVGLESPPTFPPHPFWWLVREKIPLFMLAAASAVITILAQRSGGAMLSLARYSFSERLGNAAIAYVRYLGKAFWPAHLAPLYPYPAAGLKSWQIASALAVLLMISAFVFLARSKRYFVVGWLWFLGTLVPMLGLVQVGNQAMADRYAYLPFIGLFVMICWGVAELAAQRHLPVAVTAAVSVAVLAALAVTTYRQLGYWNDNAKLWAHALQVTGPNYIAEDNLGVALLETGRPEEAMRRFRNAQAIYGDDPTSNMQIAMYEHQQGSLASALPLYQKMLRLMQHARPERRAEILTNMGYAYRGLGNLAAARQSFSSAVALDPHSFRTWVGAGLAAQQAGDLSAAVDDFSQAMKVQLSDVAYLLLAGALEKSGRAAEAQAAAQQARAISSNFDQAQRTVSGLIGH